ncbi:SDR family oxidoreductase [Metabacillus halosaccharovorans]|nr:SDR family oxidoreductase [Metabacillus halosaccharovorans]
MTKAVAIEIEMTTKGIKVIQFHSSLIKTLMTVLKGQEEIIEYLAKEIPMQRPADPEEITKLVLFLACSDASFPKCEASRS